MQRWISRLSRRLGRDVNVVATVNVARGPGAGTRVHSRQRIVQRNGETQVNETTVEREETEHDRQA